MITLNDEMIKKTGLTEKAILIDFSCWMFDKNFLTLSQAAKFCGLDYVEMMKELGRKEISILDEKSTLAELDGINKRFKG